DSGLPPAQIVVGAMPVWLTDEPFAAARAAAEVTIRRRLLPGHPLAFEEPVATPERAAMWPFILAGVVPDASGVALVMRRPVDARMRAATLAARAATSVAAQLAGAWGERRLSGDASTHAQAVVAAAIRTLEQLDATGWRSVLGVGPGGEERLRLGAEAVIERTESFDPLESASPTA
ncbi:MAG TPA: hypothetical protein VM344_07760, partial [Vitreimonas sp.]|nr:hypothetical protein [Vitreimonas sp.]